MKLAIISDLHLDYNNRKVSSENIINILKNKLADVDSVIIAGDLSQDINKSIEYANALNAYWIPGNHEFWINKDSMNSMDIYLKAKNEEKCLIDKCIEFDTFYLVGNPCWYDFSFSTDPSTSKILRNKLWNDRFAKWPMSDEQVHDFMLKSLDEQLKKCINDKPIIVVTHMVPFKKLMTYYDSMSKYTDGYIGSTSLGELLLRYNVKYSVYGHTHIRSENDYNGIHCICNPLGYVHEWNTKYYPQFSEEVDNYIKYIKI